MLSRSSLSISQLFPTIRRFLSSNPPSSPWSRKAAEIVGLPPPKSKMPDLTPMDASTVAAQNEKISHQAPSQAAYDDAIRRTGISDPESNVKLIEEELAEVVAGALKRQHEKLMLSIEKANESRRAYEAAPIPKHEEEFNDLRKLAAEHRWEMIIHRTACGFVSKNHEFIETIYKLPPLIEKEGEKKTEKAHRKFGTQTNWWRERLGSR